MQAAVVSPSSEAPRGKPPSLNVARRPSLRHEPTRDEALAAAAMPRPPGRNQNKQMFLPNCLFLDLAVLYVLHPTAAEPDPRASSACALCPPSPHAVWGPRFPMGAEQAAAGLRASCKFTGLTFRDRARRLSRPLLGLDIWTPALVFVSLLLLSLLHGRANSGTPRPTQGCASPPGQAASLEETAADS